MRALCSAALVLLCLCYVGEGAVIDTLKSLKQSAAEDELELRALRSTDDEDESAVESDQEEQEDEGDDEDSDSPELAQSSDKVPAGFEIFKDKVGLKLTLDAAIKALARARILIANTKRSPCNFWCKVEGYRAKKNLKSLKSKVKRLTQAMFRFKGRKKVKGRYGKVPLSWMLKNWGPKCDFWCKLRKYQKKHPKQKRRR
eukprot:TRINITY_DN66729_c0_g1_i1.p1 TRINITY_DN66729_c0_g1~~TRINITY_DN66729_c0_g1_i1.p1  ORF type:complete len:200 (-),score=39.97 TRINITY_DN66729_c0_g1_i1:150-749(-)